ncbi:MAG: hypothetical protein WD313_02475, partial [Acidimicrobiia bacterium]
AKFVPMHHPKTGARTFSPPAAVPHKQARGWVTDDEVVTDVPDSSPDEPAPEPEDAQEPAEPAEPEHEE